MQAGRSPNSVAVGPPTHVNSWSTVTLPSIEPAGAVVPPNVSHQAVQQRYYASTLSGTHTVVKIEPTPSSPIAVVDSAVRTVVAGVTDGAARQQLYQQVARRVQQLYDIDAAASASTATADDGPEHAMHQFIDQQQAEEYKCGICLNVAHQPSNIDCAHLYCQRCLTDLKKCPTCNRAIRKPEIRTKSSLAVRLINTLVVRCSYSDRGCNHTMPLSRLSEHRAVCQFRTFCCLVCGPA